MDVLANDTAARLPTRAIFSDPRSLRLIAELDGVARSEASILLIGETGTGKEVAARRVHERSGRAGPFVAVNCGALSPNLGEAALFGHEVGAYTGAGVARAGWFESAQGGTLFLDEVGDLPPSLQVALLRVLQERQVVRLGSRRPIPVDVRVLAATNVDIAEAVREGRFRLDLYFRLAVITQTLPPLRQRAADILALAEYFLGLYSSRMQRPGVRLAGTAERALLSYQWPGNIRELENVIHAAVLKCRDGLIEADDLRFAPWALQSGTAVAPPAGAVSVVESGTDEFTRIATALDSLFDAPQHDLLQRIEALTVQRAMARCKGNQVHTARLLGVSRNVLRTYLKRYGMLKSDEPCGLQPQ